MCAYRDNCAYEHIDASNYDHVRGQYVESDRDPRYVTDALIESMAQVHGRGRRGALERDEPEDRLPKRVKKEPSEERKEEYEAKDRGEMRITEPTLQIWLDNARTEQMEPSSRFLRDIVRLQFDENMGTRLRFPFESMSWVERGGEERLRTMEVHQTTDVVWCAMLYGSGAGVMRHLQSCLILGYALRYQLKPWLASKGVRFENLIFVTDTGLQEDAFRACSFMWSMVYKDLPQVHEARLSQTSSHLIGQDLNAAHVFLKCEAFSVDATLSLISDLATSGHVRV